MDEQLLFVSATSTQAEADLAVADLVEQIRAQSDLNGNGLSLDLALAFVSAPFTYEVRRIAEGLGAALNPSVLLGCTAEGVIGREQEIEGGTAITLVAAHLPQVSLTPFILQPIEWHKLLLDADEFRRVVDAPQDTGLFLILGDPFSTPMDDVLQAFNALYAGIPIVGGMASGALRPNGNVLFLNDQLIYEGALGVALSGALNVEVVVSQGCRPIWRPFKVSGASKNTIFNLEDRPPLAWIQELIPELTVEDRALLQNGLFVGRSIHTGQEILGRGDFLIRGVMGIDRESGAITVGDLVQEGETIQFHLRDALTAKEDLEMMLIPQVFRGTPQGALLFSCNGRGTRLYDHPNGDISIIQENLESTHLAGFFCAGEIGPISGKNFLHGHTASLVLFRSPD